MRTDQLIHQVTFWYVQRYKVNPITPSNDTISENWQIQVTEHSHRQNLVTEALNSLAFENLCYSHRDFCLNIFATTIKLC